MVFAGRHVGRNPGGNAVVVWRAVMKFFQKSAWILIGIQIFLVLFVVLTFQVDDMTLSQGDIYDFNENWTVLWQDGTKQEIKTLPFTGDCAAGEVVVAENTIPKKYWGMTLSFLSADKIIKVFVDGEEVYSFGTDDKKAFGRTPGSVMAFIDIPSDLKEGHIRMEMVSPYDNFAANLCEMTFAKRDISILNLLKNNLFNIFCTVIILFSGIVFLVLALVQKWMGEGTDGMEYLGVYCLLCFCYHAIETKALTVFYGNQTVYSMLVFLILMADPMFLLLYYIRNLPEKCKRTLEIMLALSFANIVIQMLLQVFDIVDFMSLSYFSHGLIFLVIIVVEKMFYDVFRKQKERGVRLQFTALFCMGLGAFIDLVRTYAIRVGDLGKYSRYGLVIFGVIMVNEHLWRWVKSYSSKVEENARLLKREVVQVEKQNKQLLLAKTAAEEARAEAEEAKREALAANEAKSVFLANMSHEIRTPINAVLGMDSMILRECSQPEIVEYAQNIQSSGRNLLSIINDILDLSKIESGKFEILPVEYELFSIINDCYNTIFMRAREKNLEFKVDIDPSTPSKLFGDEVRIRQIIINLLTNAVKYTKAGSIILKVAWEAKEGEEILLKVSVRDTGMGISEEDKKKLFTSFQRIEEKKNRNIEGTGLGLSITKQLIDLMHGAIHVDSEYGKGSEFFVEIPQLAVTWEPLGDFSELYLNVRNENEQYHTSFTAPEGDVLVVDDVPMNLKVMAGLLKYTKLKVDTASGGRQCLEKVTKKQYHIIFLDHMMPEMDGIETLQKMKQLKDNLNKDTPVIMLTANAIAGAKEEYMKAGFTDYISKPVREKDLEKMILKYLPPNLVIREGQKKEATVSGKEGRQKEEGQQKEADVSGETGWMERLDFLDTATGLSYCAGSEEFYKEMLGEYLAGTKYDKLKECYEKEDWENYRISVHALKSTSLSIGAVKLSEQAKQMEEAVKGEKLQYVKTHQEQMMREYRELLTTLQTVLDAEKEKGKNG